MTSQTDQLSGTHDTASSKRLTLGAFVENANAVRLAAKLATRALEDGHSFVMCTADAEGEITTWTAEAFERAGLAEVSFVNLFEGTFGLEDSDLASAMTSRVRSWLMEHAVDRLVLFNDQSRRGRWITKAAEDLVPTILIQDGHLDFKYRELPVGRKDINWYYGTSGVSAVCVWGSSMVDAILSRLPAETPAPAIHVTGSLMHSDDPTLAASIEHEATHIRRTRVGTPLRVLIFDQPMADQGKMRASVHDEALREMVATLASENQVAIKPHPSSTERHLAALAGLKRVTLLPSTVGLDVDDLRGYDLAVTFFSTAYIDAHKAQVPLVFLSHPSVNIVMPLLKSHLVRNVGSVEELREVAIELRDVGRFRSNPVGALLDTYLLPNPGVVDDVLKAIVSAAIPKRAAPAETEAGGSPTSAALEPPLSRADRAFERLTAPRSARARIVVLGERFEQGIGVSLPILSFARHMAGTGQADVRLLDVMTFHSPGHVVELIAPTDIVVVNSLGAFWMLSWMPDVVRQLVARKQAPYVYAHETRFIMEREHVARADRHRAMLDVLKSCVVLCVSGEQERMFQELGIHSTALVYNTTPLRGPAGIPSERPKKDSLTVLMVGTVQERKGLDLFSRTAELAGALGLPLRFKWVGKDIDTPAGSFRSELVHWVGPMSRVGVERELRDADIFFLSSKDDPMPLAAVEAISFGMRIVSYSNVGTREILDGVSGYRAFDNYSPDDALQAIQRVASDAVDTAAYQELRGLFSVEEFSRRMLAVLRAQVWIGEPPHEQPIVGVPATSVSSSDLARLITSREPADARAMSAQMLRADPGPLGLMRIAKAWLKARRPLRAAAFAAAAWSLRQPSRANKSPLRTVAGWIRWGLHETMDRRFSR